MPPPPFPYVPPCSGGTPDLGQRQSPRLLSCGGIRPHGLRLSPRCAALLCPTALPCTYGTLLYCTVLYCTRLPCTLSSWVLLYRPLQPCMRRKGSSNPQPQSPMQSRIQRTCTVPLAPHPLPILLLPLLPPPLLSLAYAGPARPPASPSPLCAVPLLPPALTPAPPSLLSLAYAGPARPRPPLPPCALCHCCPLLSPLLPSPALFGFRQGQGPPPALPFPLVRCATAAPCSHPCSPLPALFGVPRARPSPASQCSSSPRASEKLAVRGSPPPPRLPLPGAPPCARLPPTPRAPSPFPELFCGGCELVAQFAGELECRGGP